MAGAINFNGGGHLNHTIFWSNMAAPPLGGGEPKGQLADQINKDFGSFDAFKKELTAKAGFWNDAMIRLIWSALQMGHSISWFHLKTS